MAPGNGDNTRLGANQTLALVDLGRRIRGRSRSLFIAIAMLRQLV
eukprot:CAMPEP_0183576722 /NCGR_PEP_ID=MMETSP0371-20130417/138284_1 /TAXON_ID=268820 /ORGANISM="Peridinium aciculiferum, Strain PAER-2" /LENGTH=44 /DNA_ID= /DNA_START= /DNA_END= /DNA_ORIENTATION=